MIQESREHKFLTGKSRSLQNNIKKLDADRNKRGDPKTKSKVGLRIKTKRNPLLVPD